MSDLGTVHRGVISDQHRDNPLPRECTTQITQGMGESGLRDLDDRFTGDIYTYEFHYTFHYTRHNAARRSHIDT